MTTPFEVIAAAARRTVCQHVTDAAEATELMCMLGIYPGQEAPDLVIDPGMLPTRPTSYPSR